MRARVRTQSIGLDDHLHAPSFGHLPTMPGQAVAGDIGDGMHRAAQRLQLLRRSAVQPTHARDRRRLVGRGPAGQRQPGAERLAEHQHIARPAATLAEHLRRVHDTLHGQPEDRLGIADGVPAGDGATGLGNNGRRGVEDRDDRIRREVLGERGDVDRDRDPAAHGEDIAARVRRGDRAEVAGMIDERREEVGGADQAPRPAPSRRSPRRRTAPDRRAATGRLPPACRGPGRSAATRPTWPRTRRTTSTRSAGGRRRDRRAAGRGRRSSRLSLGGAISWARSSPLIYGREMYTIGPYRFTETDAEADGAVRRRDLRPVRRGPRPGRDRAPPPARTDRRARQGPRRRPGRRGPPPARRCVLPVNCQPASEGTVVQLSVSPGGLPKLPIETAEVTWKGMVGDRQATRLHHGRPWQALCIWSAEVIDDFRKRRSSARAGTRRREHHDQRPAVARGARRRSAAHRRRAVRGQRLRAAVQHQQAAGSSTATSTSCTTTAAR